MSETKHNLAALASDVEAALARRRSRSAAAISWVREAALLPVVAVLLVVGAILNSHFLTMANFTGVGQQISALGVVVVGESLILLIGGIDLSLESTYGLAPMYLHDVSEIALLSREIAFFRPIARRRLP